MSNQNIERNSLRIPNLPMGRISEPDGRATDEMSTFLQSLLTLLENLFGEEGCVIPSQPVQTVLEIQNNVEVTQGASTSTHTCQFGTMIYAVNDEDPPDPTKDAFVIAVDKADGSGEPVFKKVTITDWNPYA